MTSQDRNIQVEPILAKRIDGVDIFCENEVVGVFSTTRHCIQLNFFDKNQSMIL